MTGIVLDVLDPVEASHIRWQGKERCGVVVRHKDIGAVHYLECENVSATPEGNFEIAGETLRSLRANENYVIIAFWHTHPDGKPSPSSMDIEWAPAGYEIHIICEGALRRFDYQGRELA